MSSVSQLLRSINPSMDFGVRGHVFYLTNSCREGVSDDDLPDDDDALAGIWLPQGWTRALQRACPRHTAPTPPPYLV